MGTLVKTIGDVAEIQTASIALTAANADTQLFAAAPAAAATVTLPSTGVKKGRRFSICTNAIGATNPVTVNSSSGGLYRTLRNSAKLVVIALQDTPTTPAHWFEEQYQEEGTYTHPGTTFSAGTAPSGTLSETGYYQRNGSRLSISGILTWSVAGATVTRVTVVIPTFLRPVATAGANQAAYSASVQGGSWVNTAGVTTSFQDAELHQNTGNLIMDMASSALLGVTYTTTVYSTYNL